MNKEDYPTRKRMDHSPPFWVNDHEIFFVTVCCKNRGKNILCSPRVFAIFQESVQHYEQKQWWSVIQFLAMPDHVHFLASFDLAKGIPFVLSTWKSYTAKKGNFQWQNDFFDHRIRRDESWREKADYIRQNPIRAGLI